jgi:hypothetical protein
MQTYNPTVELDSTPIEQVPLNEEIARAALNHDERANLKGVQTGLLRPEKKVDESQMADFSTPIEEVMAGPNQMIQNEVMGPAQMMMPGPSAARGPSHKEEAPPKNPFGLSDEQFQAALAGAAAVMAFSKPIQTRLRSMIPNFVNDSGDASLTGLIATALVVAVIFFFAKKFIAEKA